MHTSATCCSRWAQRALERVCWRLASRTLRALPAPGRWGIRRARWLPNLLGCPSLFSWTRAHARKSIVGLAFAACVDLGCRFEGCPSRRASPAAKGSGAEQRARRWHAEQALDSLCISISSSRGALLIQRRVQVRQRVRAPLRRRRSHGPHECIRGVREPLPPPRHKANPSVLPVAFTGTSALAVARLFFSRRCRLPECAHVWKCSTLLTPRQAGARTATIANLLWALEEFGLLGPSRRPLRTPAVWGLPHQIERARGLRNVESTSTGRIRCHG